MTARTRYVIRKKIRDMTKNVREGGSVTGHHKTDRKSGVG